MVGADASRQCRRRPRAAIELIREGWFRIPVPADLLHRTICAKHLAERLRQRLEIVKFCSRPFSLARVLRSHGSGWDVFDLPQVSDSESLNRDRPMRALVTGD